MNNIMPATHYRERNFKTNIERLNIKVEVCRDTFVLKDGTKYTPDFYLPDLNCYVEVMGTRQAYSYNKEKYKSIIETHALNIMFITPDFSNLQPDLFLQTKDLKCTVPGCNKRPVLRSLNTQSLCFKHTQQKNKFGELEKFNNEPDFIQRIHLKNKAKCSVEDCTNDARAKGMCMKHYNNMRNHQTAKTMTEKCKAQGCNRIARTKGYCCTHYIKYIYTPILHNIEKKKSQL